MTPRLFFLLGLAAITWGQETVATFSIVGYDPVVQEWGVAVASRYFSVGAVVPWAEAGVGAIATQANVNVGYGPRGLELLRQGLSAKQVLEKLQAEDTFDGKDGRQITIIDRKGGIAHYTGPKANAWAGGKQGRTWSAQGNILAGERVVDAMGRAFDETNGDLAERLFAALKAGDDAGGDSRGKQSASILVVGKGRGRNTNNDRPIYINVDDSTAPIPELRRLLDINQTWLYQERASRHAAAGKFHDAYDAASVVARINPGTAQTHLMLGLYAYLAGEQSAALTELQRAKGMLTDFPKRLEMILTARPVFAPVRKDTAFWERLKQ